MQSLDEYLDEQNIDGIESVPGDPETDSPARWKLTSLDAADWAFRKRAAEQARIDEATALARLERARIDAWLEEVTGPCRSSIDYFEGLLREWAAAQVLDELDRVQDWSKVRHKTLSTPHGKVRARKSASGTFTTSDESRDAAITMLLEIGRDDLVVTSYRLGASPFEDARDDGTADLNDRGEYRVLNKATGEWVTLPGVARTGIGQISFTVGD